MVVVVGVGMTRGRRPSKGGMVHKACRRFPLVLTKNTGDILVSDIKHTVRVEH